MATVYSADNYGNPSPDNPQAGRLMTREFLFTVAVAFIINDTVKLCPIPGASVVVVDNWQLDVPDLDTGATPVIQLQLGDTDTAAKFLAAYAAGAAATRKSGFVDGVAASIPVKYTAAKDLILKVSTAPQVGATTVVIRGQMWYHAVGVATVV